MTSEEMIFYFIPTNLAFRLSWQLIQVRDLDKDKRFDRGLLNEHFCKTLVKIIFTFPILSQQKLQVAIATKVQEQRH